VKIYFAVFFLALPQAFSAPLSVIDDIVQSAIAKHEVPGAVVIVGNKGKVVYRKAFGMRSVEPHKEAMTVDTIFDLASMTKPLVTATSIMRLVELGKVRLSDPVAKYLPEFGQNDKGDITVRQLLTHYSGLREDIDLRGQWSGSEAAFRLVMRERPVLPKGARFLYSDINYLTLGFLVERVSGMKLDAFANKHIFSPLGLQHTGFVPPPSWRAQIAPTEYTNKGMARGLVHDPTARRMGGIAGHAGLFSTADDMAKIAQAFLDRKTILSPLSFEKMTSPEQPPNSNHVRGFGWDIDTPFSGTRGELLPVGSFGHTGFTGTSLWIDPTTSTYIIVLSNAVHPNGKGAAGPMRSKIANAVGAALSLEPSVQSKLEMVSVTGYNEAASSQRRVQVRNGNTKLGIDALEESGFAVLKSAGKKMRIGILTNQTGVNSKGRRTIDVLKHAPGIELVAIFSPEHGIFGTVDTTAINDTVDTTGVRIYSLYGDNDAKRRPPLDVLKTLDAVVFDIQDAGARFYTYATTLGYFVEGVAKAGIELVVLDRPNPITGSYVQGPVSENALKSFTNYMSLPIRHGMTMGELAKMFNGEGKLGAKLKVVPMRGWLRGDWFDSTGAMWINPSPNLRTVNAATLYPGVALVEGTNVSVGRGTDTPFEVLGAPFIKAHELAAHLNARQIQGVRFVPVTFTPEKDAKLGGQNLGGVRIVITDRNSIDAPELGVEIATALRTLYPNDFQQDKMANILANQSVFDAIKAGQDPRNISAAWRDDLENFKAMRKKYLLY